MNSGNIVIEPAPDRLSESVRSDMRFWDRQARKYAARAVGDVPGYERTLARTRDYLNKQDSVLEIGCGTGTTALKQAPFVRHITGADVSSQMIAIASDKLAGPGPCNVDFIVADADDQRFADAGYDAVMAHNILHLVHDLDGTLTRIRRALKPGGVLISKTPCLRNMNPLLGRVLLPLMRAVRYAPHVNCLNMDQLRAAIRDNGFEIIADELHGTKGTNASPFIVARRA